ncbi:hypothetical protein N7532_002258 [Penicillium argentinense]|uniref:Xylanolytic transcriptional activator regulatory domain-containing protein n=1 Tax=Penicillium argentinense TaxID=1131581 RepID=A0A9W9G033_9EURO|nr:uncharacterized protein N7532_002258 [Penicillium argentinense]KAJ5109613.1 hypothetical protein N7532_002258 [Penicillium argentinense]
MELTFLVGSYDPNVKRPRRACTTCRHKKKRCLHGSHSDTKDVEGSAPLIALPDQAEARDESRHLSESQGFGEESTQNVADACESHEPPRFACDSNPLVALMDDPQARLLKGQVRKRGDVGAWLYEEQSQHPSEEAHMCQQNKQSYRDRALLPPRACQNGLLAIYFRRIHPVLPFLDEDETRSQFINGTISPFLLQSICLAAAKDRDAVSFLFLGPGAEPLQVKTFAQRIYKDILRNMPGREAGNRITTIQILILLSLHEWGPNGSEDSSLSLSQAVHHAQTIGLHLRRPDGESSMKAKSLFWCLWSLDRWNSAMNGRPVLIHDRDHGQKVTDVLSLFKPPFRIWLLLADQLGHVIDSFRPTPDVDVDQCPDLSPFEDIVESSMSYDTEPGILDSLELYHHAIIILSTYSNELQSRKNSRTSIIHQRQSILSIAALCRRKEIRDLLPLSVSAYTLSLAFSIAYRQSQTSKLPSHQLLARENLTIFHQRIGSLGEIWWSAAVMMRLGKHALDSSHRRTHHERPNTSEVNNEAAVEIANSLLPASENLDMPNTFGGPVADSLNLENVDTTQANIDIRDETLSAEDPSSDLDHFFESNDLLSLKEGSFSIYFQNFLDVNFPSHWGEHSLGTYDMSV